MGRWADLGRRRRLQHTDGRGALSSQLSAAAAARKRLNKNDGRIAAELTELAVLVNETDEPPPLWISAVHDLLADRRHSPLHSELAHGSEVLAALYYLRRPGLPLWRDQREPTDGPPVPTAAEEAMATPAGAIWAPPGVGGDILLGRRDYAPRGVGFAPRGRGRSA